MTHLPDHIESAERLGYTRTSDTRCPRSLIGKPCLDEECWCQTSTNDHSATYERLGERLVVWEPYQAYGGELIDLIAVAKADGLKVTVHGSSPYNPGNTMVIEFSARDKTEVVR